MASFFQSASKEFLKFRLMGQAISKDGGRVRLCIVELSEFVQQLALTEFLLQPSSFSGVVH